MSRVVCTVLTLAMLLCSIFFAYYKSRDDDNDDEDANFITSVTMKMLHKV